jgi:hypothetical protein
MKIAPVEIHADLEAKGNVVAIELLDLEPATIAAAREYARSHGLAFPRDLAGPSVAA